MVQNGWSETAVEHIKNVEAELETANPIFQQAPVEFRPYLTDAFGSLTTNPYEPLMLAPLNSQMKRDGLDEQTRERIKTYIKEQKALQLARLDEELMPAATLSASSNTQSIDVQTDSRFKPSLKKVEMGLPLSAVLQSMKVMGQHSEADIEAFRAHMEGGARPAPPAAAKPGPRVGPPPPPPPPAPPAVAALVGDGIRIADTADTTSCMVEPPQEEIHGLPAVPRIWRHPSVVSMFLDPVLAMQDPHYGAHVGLADGEYSSILEFQRRLISTVLQERKEWLTSFSDSDIGQVKSVLRCLGVAHHSCLWLDRIRDKGIPPEWKAGEMIRVVVSRLKVGEPALFPLGYLAPKDKASLGRDAMLAGTWGAFALVVEPKSDTHAKVAVCASGGSGLQYHPRTTVKDKVKAAPIILEHVELARLVDPAFTSTLQQLYIQPSLYGTVAQHRILYEVLLPFLCDGRSLAHCAAEANPDLYATAQRLLFSYRSYESYYLFSSRSCDS